MILKPEGSGPAILNGDGGRFRLKMARFWRLNGFAVDTLFQSGYAHVRRCNLQDHAS